MNTVSLIIGVCELPFKNKKYAKKYMKEYRKHKTSQTRRAINALKNGNPAKAKRILEKKPKIHVRRRRRSS